MLSFERCLTGSMIQMYKIFIGINNLDLTEAFKLGKKNINFVLKFYILKNFT